MTMICLDMHPQKWERKDYFPELPRDQRTTGVTTFPEISSMNINMFGRLASPFFIFFQQLKLAQTWRIPKHAHQMWENMTSKSDTDDAESRSEDGGVSPCQYLAEARGTSASRSSSDLVLLYVKL